MRFRFADYVLDTDRRELTRGSERVQLGPQVFDVLVHLVRTASALSARTICSRRSGAGELCPSRPGQPDQRRPQGHWR